MPEISLILHNIRSIQNVGSIFRTADAAGVSCVYLTGYTPTPIDRFGRTRKDFAKVSLGAERSVPWEKRASVAALIEMLKKEGVRVIAIEQDASAVDCTKVKVHGPAAFILGNEVRGIPQTLLRRCDVVAEIPMRGRKESLNVSVAAGIALFCMFGGRRRDTS